MPESFPIACAATRISLGLDCSFFVLRRCRCPGAAAGCAGQPVRTQLAERYERRSLGITSNLVFSELEKVFANPMATAAAMDRIGHLSVLLEFDVTSNRANAAQNRQLDKESDRQKLLTWITNPVESPFASLRLGTDAGRRYKSVVRAIAVVWKMLVGANAVTRGRNNPSFAPRLYSSVHVGDLFMRNMGPDRARPGFVLCPACGRHFTDNASVSTPFQPTCLHTEDSGEGREQGILVQTSRSSTTGLCWGTGSTPR